MEPAQPRPQGCSLFRRQHRHGDARDAGQLSLVVHHVDPPDPGGPADAYRRAVPVTQPLVAARRWLALMSRPTARWPAGRNRGAHRPCGSRPAPRSRRHAAGHSWRVRSSTGTRPQKVINNLGDLYAQVRWVAVLAWALCSSSAVRFFPDRHGARQWGCKACIMPTVVRPAALGRQPPARPRWRMLPVSRRAGCQLSASLSRCGVCLAP